MPIVKADQPLPMRSVVIGIYGEPGVSKTTISNTAEAPLLIDFDRGVARSMLRKDILEVNKWDDVIAEEARGTFKGYKTIIIDTAKAALDDFLMPYVVQKDFKLAKNKLQAYGAIGDEFKLFVNRRRTEGVDVIIIAHAKKDEDAKKFQPDITGQSYNLVLRICDQLGYVSMQNNVRTIQWDPTDTTVGKNTAGFPPTPIPDKASDELKTFMAGIISGVKKAMVELSEAQLEAEKKLEQFTKEIEAAKDVEDLNMLIGPVKELPKVVATPLAAKMASKAKANGWVWDKKSSAYVDPNATAEPEEAAAGELFS